MGRPDAARKSGSLVHVDRQQGGFADRAARAALTAGASHATVAALDIGFG